LRLLGEKSVPRVDRLRSGLLRRRDHFAAVEIALTGRRRPEAHGFVAGFDVQRLRVRVGVDRDGLDAETARCPGDPAGDLSAVGDEDLFEQAVKPPEGSRSLLQKNLRAMR